MHRTRGLRKGRHLSFCLRRPRLSAVLVLYRGRKALSGEGGPCASVRGRKIIFRSGGLCSDRLPNFMATCLRHGKLAVRRGTIVVVYRCIKDSLSHLSKRLSGLVLTLPAKRGQISTAFIRHRVNMDGSFGGFRLITTLISGSLLGTGQVIGCFGSGPGGFSLRIALSMLFKFFDGLVVTCCTPMHARRKVTR